MMRRERKIEVKWEEARGEEEGLIKEESDEWSGERRWRGATQCEEGRKRVRRGTEW